ncbi:MAG: DNA recombination protein RmuC, partial [Leptolyngbyaceae bacterium]|nr:DNA recombination protein RmuC [Leptolyngbyaceae bacterium]
METILGIILGLVLGGGCTWLVLRSQSQTAREKVKADLVAERAGMIERLHQKDQQLEDLRLTMVELQTQLEQNHYAMREESARRAAAEARIGHLPQLEQQLRDREAHLAQTQGENTLLKAKLSEVHTQLVNEQKAARDKVALLEQAQMRLADTFKALSADALQHNNQSFLELAQSTLATFQSRAEGSLNLKQQAIDEVVKPLRDALIQVDGKLQMLERDRISAYASLTEQLKSLATSQTQLQSETADLVKALRAPTVRGRWGEIQLKRVVEMAGMVEYCDFVEQMSVESENGRLRPDMVIKLPNSRQIIVDSKAPLQAYLEAMEATNDAIRREKLQH